MNNFIGLGRITADPELRQTGSGLAVTSFTVAIDRKGKEKTTDWIDVIAFRSTAEFVCKYFKKGSPIIVEGPIQTRTWEDKTGQKRKAVEVIANNVEFVPGNKKDGQSHDEKPQQTEPDFTQVDEEDLPF